MKRSTVAIGIVGALLLLIGAGILAFVYLPAPNSTYSSSSNNSSSTSSLTPSGQNTISSSTSASLYFELTCIGCSVGNRSAGTVCGNTVPGSWIGKPWYQNEFGGELDYYDMRVGTIGDPVFGNGSAAYPHQNPFGGALQSPPPDYQGTPPGAAFELISCQGTLQAKLMSTNGSVIWQATAYPTALNDTVGYIFP